MRRQRVEDDAAAEDIGAATEGLAERGDDDVGYRENVDVCSAADGVIYNEDEVVFLRL